MYNTLEQSLNTKSVEVISTQDVTIKGNYRKIIKAKKSKGKKVFMVVQYENGLYSSAV